MVRTGLAFSGIGGSDVPSTSQLESFVGQGRDVDFDVYPPSPMGAGFAARALAYLANPGSSLTPLGVILTIPNPFASMVYSYIKPPE